jgi:hypothetical protein
MMLQKYLKLVFPFERSILCATFELHYLFPGMIKRGIYIQRISIILLLLFIIPLAGRPEISRTKPPLREFTINGDSVIFPPFPAHLKLDFRHRNISFVFAPSDSAGLRFFLMGFDNEWSQISVTGFKEYTNLPAGKYILKVKPVSDTDG